MYLLNRNVNFTQTTDVRFQNFHRFFTFTGVLYLIIAFKVGAVNEAGEKTVL